MCKYVYVYMWIPSHLHLKSKACATETVRELPHLALHMTVICLLTDWSPSFPLVFLGKTVLAIPSRALAHLTGSREREPYYNIS